ncbi:MAG TPA: vanadium-dependent haloperoxidase [Gemmatimonadaceae bacterium]|nr:vanadium-dependent haloperoxidase [Gemmatimonadaceae bacterium]
MLVTPMLGTLGACAAERPTGASRDSTAAAERAAQRAEAASEIAAWNAIALRTTAAGPFSPPRETRTMALVSAAVFDAVNSIDGEYEPYVARVVARGRPSLRAAATAAAYRVLRALYPAAAAALDADYDSTLARIRGGAMKEAGVAVGEAAAAAVLAARAGDHADDRVSYVPLNVPGIWAPTPPAFAPALEAAWGRVTPFVLDSGSQLRPPPPPAVGSAVYTRDLLEIAAIGASASPTRTAAQTEAARFWISTAPQLWNQVARQLTVARDLEPAAAARVYLLLNAAGADAIIAAWDAKFSAQQWRPVTAIRRAAAEGSLTSPIDTTWAPLITTPPFPDFPAGHTTYAGAAEVVLGALFGDRPGALRISSPSAGGATHSYQSFGEVADEVTNARVWGGVHWRTSSTVGRALGRKVGEIVLARAAQMR